MANQPAGLSDKLIPVTGGSTGTERTRSLAFVPEGARLVVGERAGR